MRMKMFTAGILFCLACSIAAATGRTVGQDHGFEHFGQILSDGAVLPADQLSLSVSPKADY
ncbi:MAG: hypothetical protein LIO77_02865, partial [Rikenellaceae bacterium]|nr:hypothetical protein [Rikenellaceae bacterium]